MGFEISGELGGEAKGGGYIASRTNLRGQASHACMMEQGVGVGWAISLLPLLLAVDVTIVGFTSPNCS